jgi:chemotaxis protein methyltransferase CheR
MQDAECTRFLQWALPAMGLRWPGFRKVRAQVCKRTEKRLRELGMPNASVYRGYLQNHAEEWSRLDALCHITISRFYRDQGIFQHLEQKVLPELAAAALAHGGAALRCWSAGCASGEEAYTLAFLLGSRLMPQFPGLDVEIIATDIDDDVLCRAGSACYSFSSIKDFPRDWVQQAFQQSSGRYCVRPEWREKIRFVHQDIRAAMSQGPFNLILCRNVAFTYFAEALQREVLQRMVDRLEMGGVLVIGAHESLPEGSGGLALVPGCQGIYRKPWQPWRALTSVRNLQAGAPRVLPAALRIALHLGRACL